MNKIKIKLFNEFNCCQFVSVRMMTTLSFNCVPMELVADSTGDSKLTRKVIYVKEFLQIFKLL